MPRRTVRSRVRWYGKQRSKDLYKDMAPRVASAAKLIARVIRSSFRRSGEGQYSRPGAIPYMKSGTLRDSIQAIEESRLKWEVVANATGDAPHAVWLEFGTYKMAARPYFRRGALRARPDAMAILMAPGVKWTKRTRGKGRISV